MGALTLQLSGLPKQQVPSPRGSRCSVTMIPWKWKSLSCVWLFATPWTIQSMEFSRPDTGVGSRSLLPGLFPTQGLNPALPHCRWILHQLNHQVRPTILEWVAYPFSSGSSRPRDWTRVSCIAGGFLTNWTSREARDSLGPLFYNSSHY